MRSSVFLACAATCGWLTASAEPPQARRPAPGTAGRSSIPEVATLLGRNVVEVSWEQAPFSEVLAWLRALGDGAHPVNVLPRWKALASAGVHAETPVTVTLQDLTVREVLEEVLDQLGGNRELTYVGSGNRLVITTRPELRRDAFTHTYNVSEIVFQAAAAAIDPCLANGHQITIARPTIEQGAGVGIETQIINVEARLGCSERSTREQRDPTDPEDVAADLMDWIESSVAPESWRAGGGIGTMSYVDGTLVVRNSADVHAQLGGPFIVGR